MIDELDRMARYVGDLVTVARAAQPDFLRPELVDVADVVDGVVQRGRAMADREWERTDEPRPGQLLTEADPERLVQAMLALVTNAVQHTVDGDRIVIGASGLGDIDPRCGSATPALASKPTASASLSTVSLAASPAMRPGPRAQVSDWPSSPRSLAPIGARCQLESAPATAPRSAS